MFPKGGEMSAMGTELKFKRNSLCWKIIEICENGRGEIEESQGVSQRILLKGVRTCGGNQAPRDADSVARTSEQGQVAHEWHVASCSIARSVLPLRNTK